MDAIKIVTAYLDAHNAHDIERTLAFLSDDFRFEAVDVWVRQGKHLARQLEEWDAAINSLFMPSHFAYIEGGATCTMMERTRPPWQPRALMASTRPCKPSPLGQASTGRRR